MQYLQQLYFQRQLQLLHFQFLRSNDFVLKQGLNHPDPCFRFAAALAIGKKNRPFHEELILLLEDNDGYVRQASRYSLYLLSEGQDFGPLPGTSYEQLEKSIVAWKEYFKQTD